MANLFQEIERNKRGSAVLLFLLLAFLGLLGGTFGAYFEAPAAGFIVAAVVGTSAAVFAWNGGPKMLLTISGAKPIEKQDHPQLWNVVEELTIAAGIPVVPKIYLIEDSAPNAFATGRSPTDASVAITRGLLDKLDRDELQGVMAHELSHVRNYDIRYAMLVGVMVGAVALFSDLFLRSLQFGRFASRRGGSRKVHPAILVGAILLAILAPISALALKMAISRKREYLADASAAELTRHPAALARALGKIGGDRDVLEAANRATQHLYIVNPVLAAAQKEPRSSLFSTHPPLAERIRRLNAMAYLEAPEPGAASPP